jgi:hypothetical protein
VVVNIPPDDECMQVADALATTAEFLPESIDWSYEEFFAAVTR